MNKSIFWLIAIKNSICMICWTVLAIVFNKWWIIFFSILSISEVKSVQMHCRACDKCGKRSPYANSYNEALDKAKEAGWVHVVEGNKDYCPDCQ